MTSVAAESVIKAVNPATGDALGDVPTVTPAQLEAALRRARLGQRDWGPRTVADRLRQLRPLLDLMVERRRRDTDVAAFALDDGRAVRITERCRYDAGTQVNRVKWRFDVAGEVTEQNLDMRCFFPLEMDALLRHYSMEVVSKFGGFAGEPFESGSAKQIYVCRAHR